MQHLLREVLHFYLEPGQLSFSDIVILTLFDILILNLLNIVLLYLSNIVILNLLNIVILNLLNIVILNLLNIVILSGAKDLLFASAVQTSHDATQQNPHRSLRHSIAHGEFAALRRARPRSHQVRQLPLWRRPVAGRLPRRVQTA
jgi:hypothetical protein